MAMPGMNTTGRPDEIDATDYVMTIIRAIRKFANERRKEVEAFKIDENTKDEKLLQEKAYRKGYLDALRDCNNFIMSVSRGV